MQGWCTGDAVSTEVSTGFFAPAFEGLTSSLEDAPSSGRIWNPSCVVGIRVFDELDCPVSAVSTLTGPACGFGTMEVCTFGTSKHVEKDPMMTKYEITVEVKNILKQESGVEWAALYIRLFSSAK